MKSTRKGIIPKDNLMLKLIALLILLGFVVIVIASSTHAAGYQLTQTCVGCGANIFENFVRSLLG